jgi:hypothetical protein
VKAGPRESISTQAHLWAREAGERVSLFQDADFRVWIGLALAGSTLLAYRSMMEHSIALFAPYASIRARQVRFPASV